MNPVIRQTHRNESDVLVVESENVPRLSDYKDILIDHKWSILAIVALALVVGLLYVTLAVPVYRGNLLIQVEESAPDSKTFLNETSGLFDIKTPATGEIQVLGSRLVLGAAVDEVGLRINARPRYLPVVGAWLAGMSTTLSQPGVMGFGNHVHGTERIEVARFQVPAAFENSSPFTVLARGDGRYLVRHKLLATPLEGQVGVPLKQSTPDGEFEIVLTRLDGLAGAAFTVSVASRMRAIEQLQSRLQLTEQGKQSNVISVVLDDTDPQRLTWSLNAIGRQYVTQNMARKSAEAEKTLAFLDAQLPVFERQLQASEDAFAKFRNQNGSVAYQEEAKVWLARTAALQGGLLDLQQQRRATEVNFTDQSPRTLMLDRQIGAVQSELKALNARIASMPNIQRDALRLERDVNVNSALYQSMQNNMLQMRLVKEGKIGNVRLLDRAELAEEPVKPQKSLIMALALTLGLLTGPGWAILRTRNKPGVRNPDEIESSTGLSVYAVLPHAPQQKLLEQGGAGAASGSPLLADVYPHSEPIEALRSLRVMLRALQEQAVNNRILITGATPGVGKSFVAGNLAAVLAQSGRRVLLVNADLRRGRKNFEFGLENAPGLSELLSGQVRDADVIRAGVRPNLDLLPTGRLPDFPTDMLETDGFRRTLDRLSANYDVVLIDAAPVLVAADAMTVALSCDVVLLVARAEHSQLAELNESVRRLNQVGSAVEGVVFNGMNLDKRYNSRYCYRHRSYRYVPTPSDAPRIAQGQ